MDDKIKHKSENIGDGKSHFMDILHYTRGSAECLWHEVSLKSQQHKCSGASVFVDVTGRCLREKRIQGTGSRQVIILAGWPGAECCVPCAWIWHIADLA